MTKLVYGLHRYTIKKNETIKDVDKLVYIDDVPNGLNCKCFCENCGGKLIAKQGNEREHHFAHADSIECEGGYEVSIIKKVELILKESKYITLPKLGNLVHKDYKFSYDTVDVCGNCFDNKKHIWSKTVVLKSNKAKLFVEILFSGDYRKYKETYKNMQQSAISINLKDLHDNMPDALKENILNSTACKYWIYNIKYNCYLTQEKISNTDTNLLKRCSLYGSIENSNRSNDNDTDLDSTNDEHIVNKQSKGDRDRLITKGKEIWIKMLRENKFIDSWNIHPVCPYCGTDLQIGMLFVSCQNTSCYFKAKVNKNKKTISYQKKYGDKQLIVLRLPEYLIDDK